MEETNTLISSIFNINAQSFNKIAKAIFDFQYQQNTVFKLWCNLIGYNEYMVDDNLTSLPFLPVSFFKTHTIASTAFHPEQIFESSGTTQTINSKHLVKDINIYKQSFTKAFELFYGKADNYCILALLPNYLERNNSSLVFMTDELIQQSKHPLSGFYLYDFEALHNTLQQLEKEKQPAILFGVTFALLDFAEQFPIQLANTIIIETGGMKGRKKEITRHEVHQQLIDAFGTNNIHSEYGMTELLSQGYSQQNGKYKCPAWMKVLIRDEEDPLTVKPFGKGLINIIDLANVYSCSFIATDDVGIVYADGSFEVLGRRDNSDLRGCSLLTV